MYILFHENASILIKILLVFLANGRIDRVKPHRLIGCFYMCNINYIYQLHFSTFLIFYRLFVTDRNCY